jgi:hypothetical protein
VESRRENELQKDCLEKTIPIKNQNKDKVSVKKNLFYGYMTISVGFGKKKFI